MQSVCIVELHAIVNYTQILSDAQQYFMVNLCHWQKCILYIPDFEKNYIPTHSFYTLHINATLQQKKKISLLMVFFRCKVWLNRL